MTKERHERRGAPVEPASGQARPDTGAQQVRVGRTDVDGQEG